MSNVNDNLEERVLNNLDHSSSAADSSTSSDELPVSRMNNSLSIVLSSPISTVSQHSTFYQTDLSLPFPLKWNAEYLHRIGLNPYEFFNYCQPDPTVTMMPDPVELIFRFIDDRLKKQSDFGLNEQCLHHLTNMKNIENNGEPLESYIFGYVENQIFKLIDYPTFESPPDNEWTTISYPTFNPSTLATVDRELNVYRNRSNSKKKNHSNINVFDELISKEVNGEPYVHLYHGTDLESIKLICHYGINVNKSHRLGSDFGPGFYVTEMYDDALFYAGMKSQRHQTMGGVICFKLSTAEYNKFGIEELIPATEYSDDPLEWSNFVRLCRHNFAQYPHVFRRDALRGPVCNNAEKVLHRNERPHMKTLNERTPIQMCIKSTVMASKLESTIYGIYVISAP